ncbi:SpoIIE family protein phosphatase [Streptomyces sp. NBC_00873]|nr:SpoIIE family protein phosphatase [Streptomyces sp. NBC_00873]WTA48671.1 SpoIIE family protein phosphatase [Streptomyces sp. NBC_00842]
MLGVRSVAAEVLLLELALVVLLVAAAAFSLVVQGRRAAVHEAERSSYAVAEAFAHSPGIVTALDSPNPTAVLQPLTEKIRKTTHVDTVVVTDIHGIRYTHPDPALIGKHVLGPYKEALHGHGFTRTFTGSRGPAVNSVVPVPRADGSTAGLVSVGITINKVNKLADRDLPALIGAAVGAFALTSGGAALISRRLRRQTHGLGPAEMTRLYEHHDAVLHSVREGVLIIDGNGRLLLANDEARRLLRLPAGAEGLPVTGIGLPPPLAELLASGRSASDEVRLAGDRLLAVNLRPTDEHGGPAGTVATLRDTTELAALADRAAEVRERLLLLHTAGVRIGTTLDVTRTAKELAEVVVPRFADFASVDLAEPVLRGEEPSVPLGTVLNMRRTAAAGVRADHPFYPIGRVVGFVPTSPAALGLIRGHTMLVPDLSAEPGRLRADPERAARIIAYGVHSLLSIPLHARGAVLGMANFWRSENPDPFDEDDLTFAEELVARAAVCVDNARRYTREHEMAVTLQRSLLPRDLPEQDALDVAYRYLPAQAGVGGDWFDVIPLPGARVALVVGDVVGHGLHAAATMGRLRTAVHNFSALDLPADELLARIDEVIAGIDQTENADGGRAEITGATCLYAVYDPVTGTCSAARAGHPGPVLVLPDGTVQFPDVPAGLPLGIGGLPFEAVELPLPEGSRLVLYTDGLVQSRERDLDTGLDTMRETLAGQHRTPEETCDDLISALLPTPPGDDAVLLVAATRILAPSRVGEWDVEPDPSAVAGVRKDVSQWLSDRGLEEETFATELILSELVTNAIRYGAPPIRVRMLHSRALICEVSDSSSTAPHLRYASTMDEGGRGLYLVAQFADRWGTRYTAEGKVIWSEQTPGTSGAPSFEWTDEALGL